MANVTVTSSKANVTVTDSTSNITVTDSSNNTINVTQVASNVTVGETVSNIVVSNTAPVSNTDVRTRISVSNLSGFGNLAYDNSATSNGVIQYTGVATSDIRGAISNTAPILYDATTGVISANTDAIFSNTLANNWFTSQTTDNLSEGSTNLYYTDARSNSAIAAYTGAMTNMTGNLTTTANISAGNVLGTVKGLVDTASNITTTANVSAGNVIATKFFGDGSELTGIDELTNAQAQAFIEANGLDMTANIDIAGANTTLTSNIDIGLNQTLTIVGNATSGTGGVGPVEWVGNITGMNSSANISTSGNIKANNGTFTTANIDHTTTGQANVTGNATVNGELGVGGNLNVTGNINSETVVDLFVEDRNITLQFGAEGTPSANSQIFVDRGSAANTFIIWSEADDKFGFSNDGSNITFFAETTDDLTEGSTNLYYTQARFDTAFGNKSTTDLSEGTNLYFTNARANAAFVDSLDNITTALSSNANITTTANVAGANFIGNVTGNVTGSPSSLAGLDTDDLSEGSTNLYYTSARADADIADYTGAIINMTGNLTTTANIQASSAEFTGAQVYLSGGDLTTSAGNVDLGGAGGITTYQGNVTIGTNAQGYLSVRSNITSTTGNIIATQGNIKVDGPNGNLIGNVITDHIVSDSSQSLQLKGQANGIQVDKTISSTESRIFDADTSGYSVASADLGAFSTNTSVPSFLTGLFITAGGNTGTSYDLAGGAGFYVQKESVNNTYTSVFGSSSLQNAVESGLGVNAKTSGWQIYSLTDGSSTAAFPAGTYIESIVGNTVTFSQNALKSYGAGSFFIMSPGVASSNFTDLVFRFQKDIANASLPYKNIVPVIGKYEGPEVFGNVTMDYASYTISGDTIDLGNVVTRNHVDINSNPDSAIRTDRALLIGANATVDINSIGKNDVLPSTSTLGITIEQDGLTDFGSANLTPQMKFMMNQYKDNSISSFTEYPSWTEFLGQSGNTTVDMQYLGAPNFNFKIIGGNKDAKAPVKSTDVLGRITFNEIIPGVLSGADNFYPPASITARAPGDTAANLTVANADIHIQSTYSTSASDGSNIANGSIPRTFVSSNEGNTVIASKPDGQIELRPQRDYGDEGNASSFVANRFPHELHEYHTFLSAGFDDKTNKTGTTVTIQDKSGRTNSNATVDNFNYSSEGPVTLQLKTHNTDGSNANVWALQVSNTARNLNFINQQPSGNVVLSLGESSASVKRSFNVLASDGTVAATISGDDANLSIGNVSATNNINATETITSNIMHPTYIGGASGMSSTIYVHANILYPKNENKGLRVEGNAGIKANAISLFSGTGLRSSNALIDSGLDNTPYIRSWDNYLAASGGVSGGQSRYDGDANIILSSWGDTPYGYAHDMDDAGLKINNVYFDKHKDRNIAGGVWYASNIALLSSSGYALADADIDGTTLAGRNVPGLLVSTSVTSGSKDITLAPLFGTAFFGIQTSASQYLASFGMGADAETALGTISNATGNGWVFYNLTAGSLSQTFETGAYAEGISANVLTMSVAATENYVGTAILLPGIHLDSGYGDGGVVGTRNDDTGVHALLQGDTSNTSIPFTNISVLGQRYTMPLAGANNSLAGGNFSLPATTFNSYDSGTTALSNVTQRHILDINTSNPGSAVRITDGALLIGRTATPDMYSGGNAVSTQASIEGITLEHDGETSYTANTTPQTRFMINQYEANSTRSLSAVPAWASLYETGNTTEDNLNLGAPVFNFKSLGSSKTDRANNNVTADTIVGKITWNSPTATTGTNKTGSDLIHPPSSITVRMSSDQTQSGANANVAAQDMYLQSTYRTSYRNGTSSDAGGIPRTFLASKAGNTTIAAKSDGRIALKPNRDYGNTTTATSYVDNRYAHELHEYHTFLDAKFLGTKTGTLVTIQPDSGETGGSTDFNYDSKGNAVLRFQTHHANNTARYNFDLVHDETNEKFIVESGVSNQKHIEISSGGKVSMKQVMRLHNLTTTEINALTGNEAGDMVFNTTLNLVCVYNGTGWRKLNDAAM